MILSGDTWKAVTWRQRCYYS